MAIAESASIDRTNLTSQSYANIYNLIKDNITDPAGVANRKFIYTREPSVKSPNDEGYPLIIIWPLQLSQDVPSLSMTTKELTWEMEIEVRSTDREKEGMAYMEQINDELFELFNSVTNRNTLMGYGMQNITLSQDDVDYVETAQESVYVATFTLTFRRRTLVSE